MTSYIQTVLDRHFQNYSFTYGIYKDNPQLLAWHYYNALKEIDEMVYHFKKLGHPSGELSFYSRLYKRKINHYYHSRVSLVC